MPKQQNEPTNLEKQFIKAAKAGDVATIRELIERDRFLLQARNTDDSTGLHCAAWKGLEEVVALLLDLGADVNAQNTNEHWGHMQSTAPGEPPFVKQRFIRPPQLPNC